MNELQHQQERIRWVIRGVDFDLLNTWEEEFVESVEKQSIAGELLTNKQIEILERIYKEKGQ